jgi:hypothetical protein
MEVIMERSKEDLMYSYAAGAIDGDGAIYLVKEKQGNRVCYIPFVQLVKKFGTLIQSFKDDFGGTVGSLKPRLPHHAPLHYWRLKGVQNCGEFLKKVSQFLVYKKERAEFLSEYIEKNPFRRGVILTSEELMEREKCHVKIMSMNDEAYTRNISMTKKTETNSDDEAFWSYMAGIMDTDGSFSVKRQKGHSETKNLRYLPQIQMSMASLDVINYIRKNCVYGTVCVAKNKSCDRGFHYAWAIGKKQDAKEFVERVLPYLKEKKEQALVLLDFCENSVVTKCCVAGIPKEELEFRESCYQKIVALNKRCSLLCESREG